MSDQVAGGILPEIITPGKIDDYLELVHRLITGLAAELALDPNTVPIVKAGKFDLPSFLRFWEEWQAFYGATKGDFTATWINQVETYNAIEGWHTREKEWRAKARAAGLTATAEPVPPPAPPESPGGLGPIDSGRFDTLLLIAGLFALGYAVKAVKA